ncbi:unnamed protein product [Phytophthora fragariaefolia]|uniref:Unnamed protein product n=1 Tax=Phytophthora fragariaefolia TaxID=1490495 RepID=A0A9W7CL11_9STRA|nr:unnamed protein product [Phytophthora fragariaefolia]
MDMIIDAASELMPAGMAGRSPEAKMSWSGALCNAMDSVTELVNLHCPVDPKSSLPVSRALFNMDQTSVFWGMGKRSTVDFVGAPTVRSTTNDSEGYRCTMALTIAADGRVLPSHFVYNGAPGGDVEREVSAFFLADVATFSVQECAWFDDRVMLEWIDKSWKPDVVEPCVPILDILAVHKKSEVADALACTGTAVIYVPGGCTGVAQPLDVGIMSPLKQHIRRLNTTK